MASQINKIGETGYIQRYKTSQKLRLHPVLENRPRGYNPRVLSHDVTDGKFICSDCKWILREPLQSFCGHRYCKDCLQYTLSTATSHPVKCLPCQQEGTESEFSLLKEDQTFPDNGIKREMGLLPARCTNIGCDWNGSFRNYESHEPGCAHKSVQCDLCGGMFKPGELATHKKSTCPAQPAVCKYCGESMTAGKLQFHVDQCEKLPVQCPGCQQTFLREQLAVHCDPANRTCPRPHISCVFGCNQVIDPNTAKEHLVKNLDNHIAELYLQIQQLQIELKQSKASKSGPQPQGQTAVSIATGSDVTTQLQSEIHQLQAKIKVQESKLVELSRKVDAKGSNVVSNATAEPPGGATSGLGADGQRQVEVLERKMMVFERVSAVFKREIEKVGKLSDDLLKTTQENKDRVEAVVRQFHPIERSVNVQKGQIAEVQQRITSSEASSYDGILVWKIANFRSRRQEAVASRTTSFYSSCFFTSRTGYKACARIYLNGDGMGKGTHVSLFFVLMRGEYDALLHWPFQQKVTLMWMDQNRRENIIDTFRPDPTSSSFKRPTSDMNIASGCPLFMPLTTLDTPNQGYVKDDVAFIKIIIDKTSLE